MESKWTVYEVANKVDWEGGVIQTMYWGLHSDEIEDEHLATLWSSVEEIIPTLNKIGKILDAALEDAQDELEEE